MILSSGIAQVILIITTPIITRLYSPTEFGEFTIFKYRNDFNTNNKCKIRFVDCEYQNDRSANILSQISF